MIVAADDAKFGQPEIRVGIMPGAGGTQRLLRTVGRYKTLLWTLTGDMVPARDTFAANLVSELVSAGQALARGIEIAEKIAAMPPMAVQAIREAVRLGGACRWTPHWPWSAVRSSACSTRATRRKACVRFWRSARRYTRDVESITTVPGALQFNGGEP